MNDKLTKPYNWQETEGKIYKKWQESGLFLPEANQGQVDNPNQGKPFTIIMPPPNANGHLHAGHGLFVTLEDIMTRYKRMRGFKTLWVPGADHAGFETQIVYEKKLEKEGRSRFKMDPQDLYKEILAFTLENKQYMEEEVRLLGASCDWTKEKFTLDPDVVEQTQKTFKKMFDDGLVYRGKRCINWCTKHQTSLSDVETESEEKNDKLYYMKYGPFTIATVRPETKFGDKYVVMHPDDPRYAEYTDGQQIPVDWLEGKITATVVKDSIIDMEFGTGVMTITPWHDMVDFEIAKRHDLQGVEVIDQYGRLTEVAGEFAGLKVGEARIKVVEKLKELGLLLREEDYKHAVSVCYKCNTTIEPRLMDQWFVKMEPLTKMALDAYERGEIKFIPDHSGKIFSYWMSNPIDWNISRQIVWGIPIPAKLCSSCKHAIADLEMGGTKVCEKCGGEMVQDPDTFDTWFSSGQWPLLSLNYPDGDLFKEYYPTDVMETGRDLVFKWVPRMVIFGLYLTKKVPFHTVYMHGLVNDKNNQKMSKSKGNVISPIDICAKFGTDALRMALIVGNTPGSDMALPEDKIKAYKNFCNKLWNIVRFVLSNTEGVELEKDFSQYTEEDNTLRKERQSLIEEVTADFEAYRFYLASEKIYHYAWHVFADKILEESKAILSSGTAEEKLSRQQFLLHTLAKILIVLHPFIPFITEEIWSMMPIKDKQPLIITKWPI